MDVSQIWRFPKKYGELFKNMSNEDIGILIRELFLWNWEKLEWLQKAFFDIIKIDLDNLEKTAMNGWRGGRPKNKKTKITLGYENVKPQDMQNDNLKEKETVKVIETEKEIKKIKEKTNKTKQNIVVSTLNFPQKSSDLFCFALSDVFLKVFFDFVNMREEIEAPLTKEWYTAIFNQWQDYKLDVFVKMVEKSTEKKWKGIFPFTETKQSKEESITERLAEQDRVFAETRAKMKAEWKL